MTKILSLLTAAGVGLAWLGLCGQAHSALINHWKFDEAGGATTAADSAGGLDLALQGDAQFVSDATRGGQVLELNTSKNDYASTTSGVPFASDTTHTVGVWVNYASSGQRYQGLMSWGASGARYFFGTGGGYNAGRMWTGIGSNTISFTESDANPLQNTWQYWTVVRDGTAASLYLDGELVQTVTGASGGSINTSEELRIGRYYGDFPETSGGKLMDDLAIWDEALEGWQIKSARSLGAENFNIVPEPSSAAFFTAVLGLLAVLRLRRPRAFRNRS